MRNILSIQIIHLDKFNCAHDYIKYIKWFLTELCVWVHWDTQREREKERCFFPKQTPYTKCFNVWDASFSVYFNTTFANLDCWNTFRYFTECSPLGVVLGYISHFSISAVIQNITFPQASYMFHVFWVSPLKDILLSLIYSNCENDTKLNFLNAKLFLSVVMFPFLYLVRVALIFICCFG